MEIHKNELINVRFDDKYYTKKFAINQSKEEDVEIWHITDTELNNASSSDLKFFATFALSSLLTILSIFSLYQIVDKKFQHHWQHPWLFGVGILVVSTLIGFLTARIVSFLLSGIFRFKRNNKQAHYQYHDKVSTIQVDHYDYLQLTRPDSPDVSDEETTNP